MPNSTNSESRSQAPSEFGVLDRGDSAPARHGSGGTSAEPPPAWLRHRWERHVFRATIAVNVLLFVIALGLATYGSYYLETHPRLKKYASSFETLASAALVGLLSLPLVRNLRYASTAGNGVRLGEQQFPEFYHLLQQHSARVGIAVPELFFSDRAKEPAHAYTSWHRRYIVLGPQLIDSIPQHAVQEASFLLGREVGRLYLRQAEWWDELVLSYTSYVRVLRAPLRRVRNYSRDRYGAWLEPNCWNALVMEAAGRRHAPVVDLDAYVRQVQEPRTFLGTISELTSEEPHVSNRIRDLLDVGLLRDPRQAPHDAG